MRQQSSPAVFWQPSILSFQQQSHDSGEGMLPVELLHLRIAKSPEFHRGFVVGFLTSLLAASSDGLGHFGALVA